MKIFDRMMLDRIERYLDYTVRRQEVIGGNLANVETPGYRTRDLDFKEYLEKASGTGSDLRVRDGRHLAGVPVLLREPVVREMVTGSLGNDLNNVDLDREMTQLAQNLLRFSAAAQLFEMRMKLLESSIRGG